MDNGTLMASAYKPKISLDEIISGQGFTTFTKIFNDIIENKRKRDGEAIVKSALSELSVTVAQYFTVKIDFYIANQTPEFQFYGFRFAPHFEDFPFGKAFAGPITIYNWKCEIDPRTFADFHNKFTAIDITTMFLYQLEDALACSQVRLSKANLMIKEFLTGEHVDHSVKKMLEDHPCDQILKLVGLHAITFTNFKSFPDVPIVATAGMKERYQNLMQKLIGAYGTNALINRSDEEFEQTTRHIINWIFDGVNDMKVSAFRYRKNLMFHMKATKSDLTKEYMLKIYKIFENDVHEVTEIGIEEGTAPNPQQIEMRNALIDGYWKRQFSHVLEVTRHDLVDDHGFAIKVGQQDIDELRVESGNITSAQDKIFLLERVYKLVSRIDNALDMLADRKMAFRVKQTKNELNRLKEECQNVRQVILNAPIGRLRYGLFVKYPHEYEG